MITLKFGGTSLADGQRLRRAAAIVGTRLHAAPLVVASAMAGATDDLLRAASEAAAGRQASALGILDALLERHLSAAEELGILAARADGLPDDVAGFLEARHAETRERLRGVVMLRELTPRTSDAIASVGELASSALLAVLLAGSLFVDARELVRTDDTFGAARPQRKTIERLVGEKLTPELRGGRAVVTQGFIGSTKDGLTTTLGRGGSDYSASLLGAAAGAAEIEIWTDVDGMMSADPRIVPDARLVVEATFEEAAELAYFGAKVLHPATIRPAVKRGIPVRILNTFRPDGRGTLIGNGSTPPPREPVRAIAMRPGITVLLISNPRMLAAEGYGARVFEAFDRHAVSIGLIATSEVSISLTIEDASRLPALTRDLRSIADVTALADQAIVAVVGTGLKSHPGVAARVFGSIPDLSVNLISMGASDKNLSFVVPETQAAAAVKRLHRTFFA